MPFHGARGIRAVEVHQQSHKTNALHFQVDTVFDSAQSMHSAGQTTRGLDFKRNGGVTSNFECTTYWPGSTTSGTLTGLRQRSSTKSMYDTPESVGSSRLPTPMW